jgi:hypothetical protein
MCNDNEIGYSWAKYVILGGLVDHKTGWVRGL